MTNMTKRNRWLFVWPLVAFLTMVLVANAGARVIEGAAQQTTGPVCTWTEVGQAAQIGRYHLAGVSDVYSDTAYFFGGLDQSGDPNSAFTSLDLSVATLDALQGPSTVGGLSAALKRYGAVGLYRSGTLVTDTVLAVFVGGAGATDGSGSSVVQTYQPDQGLWTANAAVGGAFAARLFFAGAYDTANDMGVFHGGTARCAPTDSDCTGGSFGTSLLRFDHSGHMTWQPLAVTDLPGRLYGHTMVYDSAVGRMLLFGGTTSGSNGRNDVYAMDTSDPSSLSWERLDTAGTPPTGRAFHAAAYWPDQNWMVVYGGVTSNFNTAGESVDTRTWALDLTQTPPMWMDLGTSPGRFMGAVMVYDGNHGALLLHGGRGEFVSSGSQQVNRRTFALTCQPAQEPTETPPTPGTVTATVTAGPTAPVTPTMTVTPTATSPVTPTATSPVTPTATSPVTPTTAVPPTLSPTPPEATPTQATPVPPAQACRSVLGKVPASAIADAIANPAAYYGYGMPCNPNLPVSAWNPLRSNLDLANPSVPYHPIFNHLVWRCGCQ